MYIECLNLQLLLRSVACKVYFFVWVDGGPTQVRVLNGTNRKTHLQP